MSLSSSFNLEALYSRDSVEPIMDPRNFEAYQEYQCCYRILSIDEIVGVHLHVKFYPIAVDVPRYTGSLGRNLLF